jgi:hypothetical protein
VLATYIPYFEIYVREGDSGDVLAHCGDGFEIRVLRGVLVGWKCFDLFEEGCFTRIVEAEDKDGVFYFLVLVS